MNGLAGLRCGTWFRGSRAGHARLRVGSVLGSGARGVLLLVLAMAAFASAGRLRPEDGLRETLQCLSAHEGVLFGHQLPTVSGRASPAAFPPLRLPNGEISAGFVDCEAARWANRSLSWPGCMQALGTLSDSVNASGRFPGLYGFDWQWVVGDTYLSPAPSPPAKPVPLSRFRFNPFIAQARSEGALVTIDMHFVSPLTLKAMDATGSPITQLLPGGKANAMWRSWLDGLVDQLQADPGHAFILRPFHEMTLGLNLSAPPGSPADGFHGWWWAAGAGVSPAEFRSAFQYTRWYVEEFRGATNALWAYAPSKPTQCHPPSPRCVNASYGVGDDSFYPGDDSVDIVCFDNYGPDELQRSLHRRHRAHQWIDGVHADPSAPQGRL